MQPEDKIFSALGDALGDAYPDVSFRLRFVSNYTLRVSWRDGPGEDEIRLVVAAYEYDAGCQDERWQRAMERGGCRRIVLLRRNERPAAGDASTRQPTCKLPELNVGEFESVTVERFFWKRRRCRLCMRVIPWDMKAAIRQLLRDRGWKRSRKRKSSFSPTADESPPAPQSVIAW